MSLESGILGLFFDVDNWAKDILVNNLNYPSVKEINDVVFCDENPEVMKADLLYAPDNKKYDKYPVILNIHGGGWIIGDKKNSRGMCLQFADSGVFVVNMNYGMPKKAHPWFESHDPKVCHSNDYLWPYPVKCAFAGLQWIKDNAEKYNLDIDQVYVSGDSAGSNIAAVTQTASNNPAYAEKMGLGPCPLKVAGSLLFCGFYDVDQFWGLPMNKIDTMEDELVRLLIQPLPACYIFAYAKNIGIGERTVKAAKERLGVISEKRGELWYWRLPDASALTAGI